MSTPPASLSSLRRLFGHTLLGNVVYVLSQFGVLTVLARVMDIHEVGNYVWSLAIAAPVFLLADLRLQQLQVLNTDTSFGSFLSQRVLSCALACLVVLGALYALDVDSSIWVVTAAVIAFKTVESVTNLFFGELMRRELMGNIALWQSVRGIGGLIAFVLVLISTDSTATAIGGMAAFSLVPLGLIVRWTRRAVPAVKWRGSLPDIRRITWICLPVGIAFFVGSLTVNTPRYVIQANFGAKELALFATAAYVVVFANIIVDSMANSVVPRLVMLYASQDLVAFRRIVGRMLAFGVLFGAATILGAVILGGLGLTVFFGSEYAGGHSALIALSIAAAIQYCASVLRAALMATGALNVTLPISFGNFAVVLASSFFLVPSFGGPGAGASVALGQVVALTSYTLLFRGLVRKTPATT